MKRCLAISIALVLCWPLLAVGITAADQPGGPACCRRNGAHHCHAMAQTGDGFQAAPQCPYRHGALSIPANAAPPAAPEIYPVVIRTSFLVAPPAACLPAPSLIQRPGRAPPFSS